MAIASTRYPCRAKLKPNLLAKRMPASLIRDLRQPLGCLRVPVQGWPAGYSR